MIEAKLEELIKKAYAFGKKVGEKEATRLYKGEVNIPFTEDDYWSAIYPQLSELRQDRNIKGPYNDPNKL